MWIHDELDPLWDYVEVHPNVVRVDLRLQRTQVRCPQCRSWHWYRDLVKKPIDFSDFGWRCIYQCPDCCAQVGSDDPDFEALIIEALEVGQDWVRLAGLPTGGA
jgi:hypothetical protein